MGGEEIIIERVNMKGSKWYGYVMRV